MDASQINYADLKSQIKDIVYYSMPIKIWEMPINL